MRRESKLAPPKVVRRANVCVLLSAVGSAHMHANHRVEVADEEKRDAASLQARDERCAVGE